MVRNELTELNLPPPAFSLLVQDALAKGAPVRFRAKGFSMSPFVRDGDVVTIVPLKQGFPRPGDIVAVGGPGTGKLLVHRVIGKGGNTVIIKGDNSLEPDGEVPAHCILGYVERTQRQGRTVCIGHGRERALIAWLSRKCLLVPLVSALRKVVQLAGLRPYP